MNDANDRDSRFVARCSLVLFIAGLLVPFIIVVAGFILSERAPSLETEEKSIGLAVGFGVVAEVLALILGIIGRRHLSGNIGMYGSMIVLLAALAQYVFGWFRPSIIIAVALVLAAAAWRLYSRPGTQRSNS
jgi:chromate transport protein ChrA